MADLSVRDLYQIMADAYQGREQFPPGTRWVMGLPSYRRIRAACVAAAGGTDPDGDDPELWVPHPGDMLFGLPVEVRDDGGQPHLEP